MVPINETDRIPRLLATLQFLVVYHLLVFLEQWRVLGKSWLYGEAPLDPSHIPLACNTNFTTKACDYLSALSFKPNPDYNAHAVVLPVKYHLCTSSA